MLPDNNDDEDLVLNTRRKFIEAVNQMPLGTVFTMRYPSGKMQHATLVTRSPNNRLFGLKIEMKYALRATGIIIDLEYNLLTGLCDWQIPD